MNAASRLDLACLGRAAVDLYGEQVGCALEEVTSFARYLGGSPANTAVGAARLGLDVAMISRVGDEQNGEFVRNTLAREGVDVSQVRTDPERLTALVFLAIRGPGDFPHVFYRDRCADMALSQADIDTEFIARCRALLLSGTHLSQPAPRAACLRALHAARAAKARVVLDIDYRPVLWGLVRPGEGSERAAATDAATASIAEVLPHCDLVVGTEEEFRMAGGASDLRSALQAVRRATSALLVVKRGADGCIAFAGDIPASIEEGHVAPGFDVELFNSLGGGDAFMAGFLRGWLHGEPLERCCRLGNACGAIVVSRHGCAPAMPTAIELDYFLAHGSATPRLREDRAIEHLHRARTRRAVPPRLHVLAFDHRAQLEALAGPDGGGRIAAFKALVADALVAASRGRGGLGAIVDDKHGEAILPRLTAHGLWIARPVEQPGTTPLSFEAGPNVGLALRAWPAAHVAKCLVQFHPDDAGALRESQLGQIRSLAEACARTGHEWLLEVIPPPRAGDDAATVARALDSIYAGGVKPDWWKLPPSPQAAAWHAIGESIERHDASCRGVLVLGMEASPAVLGESFEQAARNPWVRGFAVGRSIFGHAAEAWFAGRATDSQVVEEVGHRYEEVIALWETAQNA
jgi:5-dehydro-2-deoxygluconokinase